MKLSILFSIAILAIVGCSTKSKEVAKPTLTPPTTIAEAVVAEYRTKEFVARDQYRHPVETLSFFGVEPTMTVIEISPSSGWYTQILAPFLNERGQYIALQVPSATSEYMKNHNDTRKAWLDAHQEITSKAQVVDFNPPTEPLGPEGSADMVLTFRNVHNWAKNNGQQNAFNAFFKVLKPGGVLGVVEHRADAKAPRDPKSGYVREADIIKLAKKAGFKLVEKSEINANPRDTKNYPEGVWTLPPSLKLKEQDREKYVAIGESDRMTLKFMKPTAKKK